MDIEKVIERRHSVRRYTDRPLDDEIISDINRYIGLVSGRTGVRIALVTDERRALGSLTTSYGIFKGVANYLVLIGDRHGGDKVRERIGYAGEMALLHTASLGLDTCWVGLTYSRSKVPLDIAPYEKIYAIIAVGYGLDHGKPHRVKQPGQVSTGYDSAPEWFRHGVDMALLAPTALNQQKFHFALTDGGDVISTTGRGPYTHIDLGIARCHFDIGAGRLDINHPESYNL